MVPRGQSLAVFALMGEAVPGSTTGKSHFRQILSIESDSFKHVVSASRASQWGAGTVPRNRGDNNKIFGISRHHQRFRPAYLSRTQDRNLAIGL